LAAVTTRAAKAILTVLRDTIGVLIACEPVGEVFEALTGVAVSVIDTLEVVFAVACLCALCTHRAALRAGVQTANLGFGRYAYTSLLADFARLFKIAEHPNFAARRCTVDRIFIDDFVAVVVRSVA
jgi:hypothetical protein